MKTTILFAAIFFLWVGTFAQIPQALKYQAVVRDPAGQVMENKALSMRISFLSGSMSGPVVYRENHADLTTNAFGLVNIDLGKGTPEQGTFENIDWSYGSFFIRIEISPAGSPGFQEMGTTQLLSVPFAFYAKDVENKDDADADPTNEMQVLTKSGNTVTLSKNGGSFTDAVDDEDADPLNELQVLTKSGNTVTLSKNGGSFIDAVGDADADPVNELQDLLLNGKVLGLSGSSKTITLPEMSGDDWGAQVIKTLSSLTGQGTDQSPLGVANAFIAPFWSNVQGLPPDFADGTDQVNDADADPANELQELWLKGSELGLTGSSKTVMLPVSGSGGDNWGDEVVRTDSTLAGNGKSDSPLRIAARNASNGQVLKWNGTTWKPSADMTEDADSNPSNEIQRLTLTGDTLSLSGANSVILSVPRGDNWGSQHVKAMYPLSGLGTVESPLLVDTTAFAPVWGKILQIPVGFADGIDNVNYADTSSTNELQTLSMNGNQLTLSAGGGTVSLPAGTTGDNWGNQVVKANQTLTGQGTDTNPLAVSNMFITPLWNNIQNMPAGFADGTDNVYDGNIEDLLENRSLSLNANQLTISGKGGNTVTFAGWDTDESNDVKVSGNQVIAGKKTFSDTISAGNHAIINVANPVNPQDVATKAYVDALLQRIKELESQPGLVKDIDGNLYTSVKIGNQIWMSENLKTTRLNDGSAIPQVTSKTEWASLSTPAFCWYENDEILNGKAYGALYNWYTVNSGRLCPNGYHIPVDNDWTVLSNYLIYNGYSFPGGDFDIAKSLAAKTNWNLNNTPGTPGNDLAANNSSGFTGLPGGYRNGNGTFGTLGGFAYWWSSTENTATTAWYRYLFSSLKTFMRNSDSKNHGFSVRCIKDE